MKRFSLFCLWVILVQCLIATASAIADGHHTAPWIVGFALSFVGTVYILLEALLSKD